MKKFDSDVAVEWSPEDRADWNSPADAEDYRLTVTAGAVTVRFWLSEDQVQDLLDAIEQAKEEQFAWERENLSPDEQADGRESRANDQARRQKAKEKQRKKQAEEEEHRRALEALDKMAKDGKQESHQ